MTMLIMKKFVLPILLMGVVPGAIQAMTSPVAAPTILPDFDENDVNVITTQPHGELRYYDRTGFEVNMTSAGVEITNQSGICCVVFGTDGEVWLKDPVSNDQRDSWVKGEMDADSTTIHVATGQFIDYMPSISFGRELYVLDFNETTGMYSVNPSVSEIVYTIKEGRISLEDTSRQRIIGSIFRCKGEYEEEYHYEGTWSGKGDYETVYVGYADTPCTVPADAECEPITFRAPVNSGGQWTMKVMEAKLFTAGVDEVYLSGFCSSGVYFTNLDWTIKGVKEEGKLIFPTGQFLGAYYGNPYYFAGTHSPNSTDFCDVVFTLNDEGVYESNDFINFMSSATGEYAYFYYDGATLSNKELPEIPTPPASARQHLYKMSYQGYIPSIDFYYDSSANVTVAATDTKIYIKGIYYGVPDSWVVGDIVDDKVIFSSTQYLGFMSEMCPEMWFMAFGDEFDRPLEKIEFDYDPATGALTNPSANISVSICERRNLGMQWFFRPSFSVIEENSAIPANPSDLEWITYEWDDQSVFAFEVPLKDVDGNNLVENWLCYRIYTDTEENGVEVFSMTPEDYPDMNLNAPLDLFPYNYFGFDITFTYNRHYVTMRTDWAQYKRVGVQSIYDAGGEENCSEIVWIDLAPTGVDSLTDDSRKDDVMYNLQGQIVKGQPAPGIYIRNGKKVVIR